VKLFGSLTIVLLLYAVGGVARTFIAGKTPIKATIQVQYFVTRPENFGPSWRVFFQITPVVELPWGG